jgi:3-oxoacyl-[acyl-carrier-protein] synthase III
LLHRASGKPAHYHRNRRPLRPLEKVIINIDRYGNTTAGTIPLAIRTALDEGKVKKGDLLLIAAVGAGFTSGATLMRWAF